MPPAENRAEAADNLENPPAPLTFEEETKRHLHPLDAYSRLLDCASANRPPDAADRFRFQWFGLFYHGPGQDAFTLRLRLPGGRLKWFQLAGLAEITQEYAGGQVVCNAQGGLDVPGVPVVSAVRILQEVEGIGLSTRCAGGDCVQTVRGGEYDGFHPTTDQAPVYPWVRALEQAVTHGPVFADLPGLCEIVFQAAGGGSPSHDPQTDTLLLQSRVAEEQTPGLPRTTSFLLLPPGELQGGFELSGDQLVSGCLALLRKWVADADRSSRASARLGSFLAGLRPEALHTCLEGAKWVPLSPKTWARGSVRTGQVGLILGQEIPAGRLLSRQLAALERTGREEGWQEVRLGEGRLYAISANGELLEASETLAQALDKREK